MRRLVTVPVIIMLMLAVGCARITVLPGLPDSLAARVDQNLTFRQLTSSPAAYTGRVVTLGGEVLKTTPVKDGTIIEVLQLPLDSWEVPKTKRTASQGRFLAFHDGRFDPAVLEGRTPVTIVGEVTGEASRSSGDTNSALPILDVQYLRIWEERPTAVSRWDSPPYAPYRLFLLP